ncbi:MAG: hypothetical protein GY820_17715 [Gammaproteobacteria bacterium]|nr:hypothetical protein [Gammaproteobacteria bacterium]
MSECIDNIENENAAFSNLKCNKIGSYELNITVQEPIYFTISLKKGTLEIHSEFEELSGELPLETGPTIEWHLSNEEPRFMVYRVSWGTDETPFTMTEYLTINYVAHDRICPIAKVNAKGQEKANERVRELINNRFSSLKACTRTVEIF